MHKSTSSRFIWFALRASTALALTVAPYHLSLDAASKIGPAAAYAKSGDGGGGGEGHGGGGSGGSGSGGNSGSGGGDDGGDHDSGNSGPGGGGDDGPGDDHGANDSGHHGHEHVNAATGDKVEVEGNKIEVTHPDGTKEEIENGRLETKDASGRTIVERRATPADIARLNSL
ncbi:hypothetical protein EN935_11410 [Mesorhizobium sp. M7D.F.Ca.US.004.03.1.1]|uniref:hypothetical protein n=1 Tax=Mesorhizobium sp. M7D.F.Ca.US.004.03.1.1 TaxID=2496702 RepID=UPI000FCC1209|nr:hypothetical protein [Mesorhizobium sp. M7D.F.Ca.US.004.03.1.1]RUX97367.1 hypothetical protein EN993_03945 [Mesorhizobium sp. M7D.F.Ca.US.004.01.2.1]RVA32642.1 hypothetical protein EN935_11410 [Mesorhizobium sp. M7D.F.Ca.US.004.03.1.1]